MSGPSSSFETITETPGVPATSEQLAMLRTRYELARQLGESGAVLEVACGSGIGLGYLTSTSSTVIGSDIDEANLGTARATYSRHRSGPSGLVRHSAERLPFHDNSFDVVLLLEAMYYLEDPVAFLREARRVLSPNGSVLICSVNPEWSGFNPSPFSTNYFGATQLESLLAANGFTPTIWLGFQEDHQTAHGRMLALAKRGAVRLGLIPKTMKGKALLKRLAYGPTTELPEVLAESVAEPAERTLLHGIPAQDRTRYKVVYAAGTVSEVATR